jgi:hypothetical protein
VITRTNGQQAAKKPGQRQLQQQQQHQHQQQKQKQKQINHNNIQSSCPNIYFVSSSVTDLTIPINAKNHDDFTKSCHTT